MAMGVCFQKSHLNFYRKSRTPPFPQTTGPAQILPPKATTKNPFWGCSPLKFNALLTFHKRSAYAAFEKNPHALALKESRRSLPAVSVEGLPAVRQAGYGTLRKAASFHTLRPVPYALRRNIDTAWRRMPCLAL